MPPILVSRTKRHRLPPLRLRWLLVSRNSRPNRLAKRRSTTSSCSSRAIPSRSRSSSRTLRLARALFLDQQPTQRALATVAVAWATVMRRVVLCLTVRAARCLSRAYMAVAAMKMAARPTMTRWSSRLMLVLAVLAWAAIPPTLIKLVLIIGRASFSLAQLRLKTSIISLTRAFKVSLRPIQTIQLRNMCRTIRSRLGLRPLLHLVLALRRLPPPQQPQLATIPNTIRSSARLTRELAGLALEPMQATLIRPVTTTGLASFSLVR